MLTYHAEARRHPKSTLSKNSLLILYGKTWEVCEGSHGLLLAEISELIRQWNRDDRLTAREFGFPRTAVHEYRPMAD